MSEIKTCEQYVLARLQELENENTQLKYEQEEYNRMLEEQRQKHIKVLGDIDMFIRIIRKYAEILTYGDEHKKYLYIDINEYGESSSDFYAICELLQIKESEEE